MKKNHFKAFFVLLITAALTMVWQSCTPAVAKEGPTQKNIIIKSVPTIIAVKTVELNGPEVNPLFTVTHIENYCVVQSKKETDGVTKKYFYMQQLSTMTDKNDVVRQNITGIEKTLLSKITGAILASNQKIYEGRYENLEETIDYRWRDYGQVTSFLITQNSKIAFQYTGRTTQAKKIMQQLHDIAVN